MKRAQMPIPTNE